MATANTTHLLEFEKPLHDLETKLEEMRNLGSEDPAPELEASISELEERVKSLRSSIYENLTRWQRVLIARHPHRPYTLDHIEALTDGSARLDPANLYRAVKRLSREGLIDEAEPKSEEEEQVSGERRRYWGITDVGRRVVTAEAARLAQLAALARSSGLIPQHRG